MKQLLIVAALSIALAACTTTTKAYILKSQDIQVNGLHRVAFQNVRVKTDVNGDDQLLGSLRRIRRSPVYFGWLRYDVTDNQGRSLQKGYVGYTPEIKKRKTRRPSRFSIPLKFKWQPGVHHANIAWTSSKHDHTGRLP